MGFPDKVRSAAAKVGPVTLGLLVALIAVSAFGVLDEMKHADLLAMTPGWASRPWTILAYPFLADVHDALSLLFFLCMVSWIVWMGGSVERDLGSMRYGLVWIAATILPAVFLLIGIGVIGLAASSGSVLAAGPLLQISALTVIWGFRNKTASVMLFAFLPLTGVWLAFLAAVICFVSYAHPPVLGVFACLHLILAWAYATDRLPALKYGGATGPVMKYKPSKAQVQKEKAFFDDVRKREQERQERERLRKLFEASFDEDEQK